VEYALGNDALPTVVFAAFLHLKACIRIAAQPIYLLPRQGKDIELFRIERIVDRYHVRSVVVNTSEMPDMSTCKDFSAFAFRHLSNGH
jgi:hypothetical protein